MATIFKIGLVILLFGCLAAVRFYQEALFYDPLLDYFKSGYLDANALPKIHIVHFVASVFFRFWLNTAISLLVLFVAFRDLSIIKFSLLFYGVMFIILITVYMVLLLNYDPDRYLPLFYIRRFLIQPLFVILLLPAFYYQKRVGR